MGDASLLISCVLCDRLTPQETALVTNPVCDSCRSQLGAVPLLHPLGPKLPRLLRDPRR